jgi:hypothetical protein
MSNELKMENVLFTSIAKAVFPVMLKRPVSIITVERCVKEFVLVIDETPYYLDDFTEDDLPMVNYMREHLGDTEFHNELSRIFREYGIKMSVIEYDNDHIKMDLKS